MIEAFIIVGYAIYVAVRNLFKPYTAEEITSCVSGHKREMNGIRRDRLRQQEKEKAMLERDRFRLNRARLCGKYGLKRMTNADYEYYCELEKVEQKDAKRRVKSDIDAKVLIETLKKNGTIPNDMSYEIR